GPASPDLCVSYSLACFITRRQGLPRRHRPAVILCPPTPDAYGMGVEVSPLHARRFKSAAVAPPFHVSAMFPEAHPRGVKRKARCLDDLCDDLEQGDEEEEEEDEEDSSSSSSCSSGASSTSTSSVDDLRSYSRRRHVVFNMSLCKLSRFRQAADPSLLRSVLVCNTLRALERDLGPPLRGPDPPPTHLAAHHHHHHHYGSQCHASHYADDCYDRCPPSGGDGGGRLTPFVRSSSMASPATELAPLWTDEDRLPSLNWSSVLNFGSGPTAQQSPPTPNLPHDPPPQGCGVDPACGPAPSAAPLYTLLPAHNGHHHQQQHQQQHQHHSNGGVVTSSSSQSSSSNSSGSSSDEIFGDIDLSLYDFDLLTPLSPPSVKLAPVTAEDLMRSLAASSQSDCVVTTMAASSAAASCQLVASSGQQVSFCYKGIGEDHVATVMS
ncbi:hypothetical protein HPB47_009521, partial [Ixodes persulcatus]